MDKVTWRTYAVTISFVRLNTWLHLIMVDLDVLTILKIMYDLGQKMFNSRGQG
jgi:hypothetical protein